MKIAVRTYSTRSSSVRNSKPNKDVFPKGKVSALKRQFNDRDKSTFNETYMVVANNAEKSLSSSNSILNCNMLHITEEIEKEDVNECKTEEDPRSNGVMFAYGTPTVTTTSIKPNQETCSEIAFKNKCSYDFEDTSIDLIKTENEPSSVTQSVNSTLYSTSKISLKNVFQRTEVMADKV